MTSDEQLQFMQAILIAIAEYVAVTDHLFDDRGEPRTSYEYDDDPACWERMVTPRANVTALLAACITYE